MGTIRNMWRRAYIARTATAAFGLVFLGSGYALAHHSFAMFDQGKEITLKGSVASFAWGNPHVYLRLNGKGKNGDTVQYVFEGGSVNMLTRYGWKPRSLKAGDTVIVVYHPLRNGDPGGALKSVQIPTGQVLKTW